MLGASSVGRVASVEKQKMTENLIQNEEAKRKDIDDWLPITSSRNAKWWYSAFHNVTAMVGAGVLSLPYAMAHLGWYVSCLFHFLIGVLMFGFWVLSEIDVFPMFRG